MGVGFIKVKQSREKVHSPHWRVGRLERELGARGSINLSLEIGVVNPGKLGYCAINFQRPGYVSSTSPRGIHGFEGSDWDCHFFKAAGASSWQDLTDMLQVIPSTSAVQGIRFPNSCLNPVSL
jgi:hypothetical protein